MAIAAAALGAWAVLAATTSRDGEGEAAGPAAGSGLCRGCLYVPAKGERRPLVILLHGDRQPPRRMLRAFRAAAAKADVALLAPPCPTELGCSQRSFWRWGGDPAWLSELAGRAVALHDLDAARVALVAWSGGATYLGKRMAALGDHYSAAVLLGGGVPGPECAARPMPIFMVQGDRNPMHELTVALRQRLEQCHHEVQWHLVRGADHAAEWEAVSQSQMQRKIFEFLAASVRPQEEPQAPAAAATQGPGSATAGAEAGTDIGDDTATSARPGGRR